MKDDMPDPKMKRLTEFLFWGIIILSECGLSSSCSDKGTSSAIGVNITCDSYLELYVDGKLLGGGATNVTSKGFFVYQIMPRSHVVALSCKASAPPWEGGILGSFENGLVTDTSWKCITTARYGWNMRKYRDDDWPMALPYGPNNKSTLPWGRIPSIDEKAVWIWSADNKGDTEVYCRHSLVAPCTEVKSNFFKAPESGRDMAIAGFSLLRTKVASAVECGLKCGQRSACASFAVEYSDSPGSKLCELNTVKATSHPESVVRKKGFQYYDEAEVFY
ncbi:uncharacterized protein LOC110062776 [Orbicella faveolata]|uniref:uncharacterized protein LOC110062776 n=1 Tax=Orbicella faveolata TaxID=48498 RepID=UPI0009E34CE3|nr:uncharacterized protein LOC110062776 [Orbicella faveolata]XP_020625385.1 uncharacterized protein LOC110062776 [Orbicella faveolata]